MVYAWAESDFSGRDLVLLGGGLFLLVKSVLEIHQALEGRGPSDPRRRSCAAASRRSSCRSRLIDIVFSLDSVFTAVGLARELPSWWRRSSWRSSS